MRSVMLFSSVVALVGLSGLPEAERPLGTNAVNAPTGSAVQIRGRLECPMDWAQWIRGEERGVDSIVQGIIPVGWQAWDLLPLAWGSRINIPEFHDCQRFILERDSKRSYTKGFFAIFADRALSTLDQLETAQTCPSGCTDRDSTTVVDVITEARPAAWIYAEEDYPPLEIAAGANCLIVYKDRGRWKARMVWMGPGSTNVDCLSDVEHPTQEGSELLVRRTITGGFGPDNYPNVARWDWDYDARHHYIGIGCGSAWCEVGRPAGFTSLAVYPDLALGPDTLSRRTVVIKGWFDEQYLATLPPFSTDIEPTALIGTTFPDPMIGQYSTSDTLLFKDRWVPVARIALRVDPDVERDPSLMYTDLARYKAKFNLDLTEGPYARLNEMSFCYTGPGHCGVPESLSSVTECTQATEPHWWAKIEAARGGPERYVCVRRHPSDVDPPGAVRWRWMASDEGNWIRCLQGCCEVLGPH